MGKNRNVFVIHKNDFIYDVTFSPIQATKSFNKAKKELELDGSTDTRIYITSKELKTSETR